MDYTGYGDAPNDDLSLRQAWANMLRGLSNKQSWQDLGTGIQNTAQLIPNVAESVTRGGVAGTVGAFGDLRDFKNQIQSYLPQSVQNFQAAAETLSNPMARALVQRSPSSEDVYKAVPRITDEYEGYKQHEKVGEFIGPAAGGVIYDVAKLGEGLPVGGSIKLVDEAPVPKTTKDDLGFYSTLDEAVNNLKQEKGTNAQYLAQLLKTNGVKQEEIAYRGLDEFLKNNPKVTKQEIQDYLLHNKAKLEETILDENHYSKGTYEDYQLRDAEAIDDPDYINSHADDISYEYKNDPNMVEQARQDLLERYPEQYQDWDTNPTTAERLQKDIEIELDNTAYSVAESSYWEDPIYRYADEFGYEITGNENMGYSIKDERGRWIDKSFNDISDAEAYLRDRHLENGDLRFEEEGPKYADYQTGGPSKNYREVLIQVPESFTTGYSVTKRPDGKFGIKASSLQDAPYLKGVNGEDMVFDTAEKAAAYTKPPAAMANQGTYQSGHFDQPNIVAHMRVNDRIIDGKKTLFVEEIQSDWHQAGRKKGYATPVSRERKAEIQAQIGSLEKDNRALREERKLQIDDEVVYENLSKKIQENDNQQQALRQELSDAGKVPDAPYKKNWQEMAMRRAIQMAADGGYERVAFTTGKTQADRYSLSKQIDSIDLKPAAEEYNKKFVLQAWKDDRNVIRRAVNEDELADYIGKEAAQKLIDAQPNDKGVKELKGLDLDVGGEGMKGFYDKILPDYVNKYGKKHGLKVGKTNLENTKNSYSYDEFRKYYNEVDPSLDNTFIRFAWDNRDSMVDKFFEAMKSKKGEEVHYFDITPEAKASLVEKGSPLFAVPPALGLTGEESRREILEKLMK